MALSIQFLGTGTSNGVPMLGCSCAVCQSTSPENKRLRSSILVTQGQTQIVVDTGPDFRTQALRAGIKDLSGVLYTHHHADHLHGIDDLRPFGYKKPVPIWTSHSVQEEIRRRFDYIFQQGPKGTSTPQIQLNDIWDRPINIGEISVQPICIYHGPQKILGFRFGDMAYLTDCTGVTDGYRPLIQNIDTLILGALRERPHPTHFSVEEAIDFGLSLRAKRIYLTHISHEIEHQELQARLPQGVFLAYDGLVIESPSTKSN